MSEQERKQKNEVFGAQNQNIMQQGMEPTLERIEQDLGFEIPVESVPLPSGGKVYPKGSPLHLKESLDMRSMTAKDEEILTSRALVKSGKSISRLLKSCLMDKTIDVGELISGDQSALLVGLRTISHGADYKAEITCSECDRKQDFEFDLSQIPVKYLKTDPMQTGENKFEVFLPASKKKVIVRFLTSRDEEEIVAVSEKLNQKNILTTKMKYSVISIDGETDKAKIDRFVRNMLVRDARALRAFLNNEEPSLDMTSKFTCVACDHEEVVGIPMNASFFWPE